MNKAYAGIDLGGTNIKFGLVSTDGEPIIARTVPSNASEGTESILASLLECGQELLLYADENGFDVDYLGIGSPGTVDSERGRILGHSPNIPGWQDTEVSEKLSEKLNLPVHVDNDANVMAVAEVKFGAARGYENVICTTVGTGIGGAVIIAGQLVRGASYSAGELGHVPVVKDGKKCSCGLSGCVEAYAGASGLLDILREKALFSSSASKLAEDLKNGREINIKELLNYYRSKDSLAIEVLKQQADYLATGLVGSVHLLNPEAIVIGGGIADGGGSGYVRLVSEKLKQRVFADAYRGLKVLKAELGNKAGFIGASVQREKLTS
jgi:glucokinase